MYYVDVVPRNWSEITLTENADKIIQFALFLKMAYKKSKFYNVEPTFTVYKIRKFYEPRFKIKTKPIQFHVLRV